MQTASATARDVSEGEVSMGESLSPSPGLSKSDRLPPARRAARLVELAGSGLGPLHQGTHASIRTRSGCALARTDSAASLERERFSQPGSGSSGDACLDRPEEA